jgi:hypothetical protein
MPYIKQEARDRIDPAIDALIDSLSGEDSRDFKGMLNYALTRIVAGTMPAIRYSNIADAIAALECAKLELYTRIARPYEDMKRSQEGDVREYGAQIING